MIFFALKVLVGLVLLAFAADKFVDGASGLARSLGVSKLVIGLIVVGFGTSAPELLVSTKAALSGSPGIAIGNALGSNIANIALVVGVTAFIKALPVGSGIVRREFPFLGLATTLALLLLMDGQLSRIDAVIMSVLLIVILVLLLRLSSTASPVDPVVIDVQEGIVGLPALKPSLLLTAVGLVGMLFGSDLLVDGAKSIAEALEVPDLVIGLTIVAIGTSLPELAASIASARKDETDLVIGNVIGSNLFNTLGVIGIAGVFAPCEVPEGVLTRDFPIMIVLTIFFFLASMTPWGAGTVSRGKGLLFVAAFFGYQLMLAMS